MNGGTHTCPDTLEECTQVPSWHVDIGPGGEQDGWEPMDIPQGKDRDIGNKACPPQMKAPVADTGGQDAQAKPRLSTDSRQQVDYNK